MDNLAPSADQTPVQFLQNETRANSVPDQRNLLPAARKLGENTLLRQFAVRLANICEENVF